MDAQHEVATFIETHNLEVPPEFRLLDLVSELGEISKEAVESTEYGAEQTEMDLSTNEIGDALFALLALCEQQNIEAEEALQTALAKYRQRMDASGSPSSR